MNIPPVPVSPVATSARMVSTTVISVMPETGLTPTMAIAWAATGVNRKDRMKPTPCRPPHTRASRPPKKPTSALEPWLMSPTTKNSSAISRVEPNWINNTFRGRQIGLRAWGRRRGAAL